MLPFLIPTVDGLENKFVLEELLEKAYLDRDMVLFNSIRPKLKEVIRKENLNLNPPTSRRKLSVLEDGIWMVIFHYDRERDG